VVVPGVVESLKIITEKSTRIARFAFEYAAKLGEGGVGVFEAVHVPAVLMLQQLHDDERAARILDPLRAVLASGRVTADLCGTASTSSFAAAICPQIERG
jgi:isocitrate/isopropylmalate dehydrogenase